MRTLTASEAWELFCRLHIRIARRFQIALMEEPTADEKQHLGCDWFLCELNPEYAKLAEERIAGGWKPREKRTPKKRQKKHKRQRELFE